MNTVLTFSFRLLGLGFLVNQPPVQQRVVDEGLQDGHEGVLVPPEDLHGALTGRPVGPLYPRHLHGVDQHPRQSEGDLLRELLPGHRHLEAVPEVDVENLA